MKQPIKTVFLFACAALCAFGAIEGKVAKVGDSAIEADAIGAKVGMSAIVIYKYDGGETISNRCVAIKTTSSGATLRCKPFAAYDQDSVPTLLIKPRIGDKVVFEPLSDSAIVIAPSVSRLVRVQERHKNLRYLHPDLFANRLAIDGSDAPSREDFGKFCDRYLVGTVIFAFKDGDYFVDCQTFALLEIATNDAATSSQPPQIPFFHRLEPFAKSFNDFDRYYKSLLNKEF